MSSSFAYGYSHYSNNLHPISSPSEHSVFSVKSLSSSTSSLFSQNGINSSPEKHTSYEISSSFGVKIKKALSRSNSLQNDLNLINKKNMISNPVPLTNIPIRKGSVDLKNFNYQEDELSLKNNSNYYFNHKTNHDRPLSVPSNQSISSSSILEEGEEDEDFYFTSGSESNSPEVENVNLSPFDVIFNSNNNNNNNKKSPILPNNDNDEPISPILPLKFNKRQSTISNNDEKRLSSASTIKLNRNSINYRSSRITLNRIKINQVNFEESLRSPDFPLFSPTKQEYEKEVENSFNKLMGIRKPNQTKKSSKISIHNRRIPKNGYYSLILKDKDSIEIDCQEAYDLPGVFKAHEMAFDILNKIKFKPFLNKNHVETWI